jgi:hypothetical protein
VQPVPQQGFRAGQELARQRDDQVGAIADFSLLGLGRVDEQAGGRVLNFQLGQDGGRVGGDEGLIQVVDHDLFHACAEGGVTLWGVDDVWRAREKAIWRGERCLCKHWSPLRAALEPAALLCRRPAHRQAALHMYACAEAKATRRSWGARRVRFGSHGLRARRAPLPLHENTAPGPGTRRPSSAATMPAQAAVHHNLLCTHNHSALTVGSHGRGAAGGDGLARLNVL